MSPLQEEKLQAVLPVPLNFPGPRLSARMVVLYLLQVGNILCVPGEGKDDDDVMALLPGFMFWRASLHRVSKSSGSGLGKAFFG